MGRQEMQTSDLDNLRYRIQIKLSLIRRGTDFLKDNPGVFGVVTHLFERAEEIYPSKPVTTKKSKKA